MNTHQAFEVKFQEMWEQYAQNNTDEYLNAREKDFWENYEGLITYSKQKQVDQKKMMKQSQQYSSFTIDKGKKQLLWQQIFRDTTHKMLTTWVVLALFSNLILIFSGVSARLLLNEIIETLKIGNLLVTVPCLVLFFGRIQAKTTLLNTIIEVYPDQITGVNTMAKPKSVPYEKLIDIQNDVLGLRLICNDNTYAYQNQYETLLIPYALKDFDQALQKIYFYWENSKIKQESKI